MFLAIISNYPNDTFSGWREYYSELFLLYEPSSCLLRPQRKATHRILPPSKLIMQCILWFNNTQSTLAKLYMLFTCFPKNINKLFRHKILFWCSIILFLSTCNTFFVDMEHLFMQHQLVFVGTRLLFVQRQTFCLGTKMFFVQH